MADKQEIIAQAYHAYSGPLPPPESLIKYNEAVEGAAERILKMAEEEMKQRHKEEEKRLSSNIKLAYLSVSFTFLTILVLAGVVCYALKLGQSAVAVGTAIGAIASVAGLFVYAKARQAIKRG